MPKYKNGTFNDLDVEEYDVSRLKDADQRFVYEYVRTLELTTAYKFAYSYIGNNASKLATFKLRQPAIAGAIKRLLREKSDKYSVTVDRVMRELAIMAFSDVGAYLVKDPETGEVVVDASKVMDDLEGRRAITEFNQERYIEGKGLDARTVRKTRIKMGDKLGALNSLCKILNIVTDRVEVTGKDGGPIEHDVSVDVDLSGLSVEELEALDSISGKLSKAQ